MAKTRLTQKRVAELDSGGPGQQAYLWDSDVAGLGVRAIGKQKYYLIQTRINKKAIQYKMGDVGLFTTESARTEARRLLLMIGQGIDPREDKKQRLKTLEEDKANQLKEKALREAQGANVLQVWTTYLEERKPSWGERHYIDHLKLSQDGSVIKRKGGGPRKPGPLAPLMALCLSELTSERLELWIKNEVTTRPTQSNLALSLLRAFIRWCSENPEYKHAVKGAVITSRIKAILPKKTAKSDCLQIEQLPAWFKAVSQIHNPVIASYLQALLLTGARKEELARLKWSDIDFTWKTMEIRDKIEGKRAIPLTPYTETLIQNLPRINEWVFSSPTAASGRLQSPFTAHRGALRVAAIEHLSLHGLRRSFATLSEWSEIPVGVIAQIQGHKPSAIAEKHYHPRPIDLLRMHHTTFEKWILKQAGISF